MVKAGDSLKKKKKSGKHTQRNSEWPKRVLHKYQETTEDGHSAMAASPNFCTQPGHCGVTFCT